MRTIFICLSGIYIVLAYVMVCPDRSQRLLRSQGLCINKNSTKYVYTCLEDVNNEVFVESCSEEEDAVRPGKRYVVKGQTTGDECSTDRYQPMKFDKTSGAICIYFKSTCTEVGQVVARNGSGIADATCICVYNEGYAYVTRPRDVCNCVPAEEDCTCYEKLCPENHFLSADNECIYKNATSMSKCATMIKFGKDVTTTIRTDYMVLSNLKIGVTYAAVFVTVITVICILTILYCYRPTKYFTQNLTKTLDCIEGDNVKLQCAVCEADLLAYWSKNGIICQSSAKYKITDIGKYHTLSIAQIDLQDAGDYTVMINNQRRSSSVHVKEYFAKTLETQTCIEGENVHFECEVLDDNQTALWFKDGIEVYTSDKYKVERHGNLHRLVVNNTQLDDKGEYSVRIKNCLRLSKLIVQEYFTKRLVTQACIEGENVHLECEVLDGNELAMWFKDGIEVNTSEKYKMESLGNLHSLFVNNTTLDDKGEYSVRIKNCTQLSKLIVREYFTKTLENQTCIEGENVHFECEVLDDNETAMWFKDGIEVDKSDKYKVERRGNLHGLVVNNTKLDDKAEYSVRIKNCIRLSKLVVQEIPPSIRQLSAEDKDLYLEIIKSATETRYYIRIVIIGENGVGKTCLLRRLHGESIDNVESTDGIDVVHRCKIRHLNGQWVIDSGTEKKDVITRIKKLVNEKTHKDHQNQSGKSKENKQSRVKINCLEDKIEVTKLSDARTNTEDKMLTEQSTQSTYYKDKVGDIKPSTLRTYDKVKKEVAKPSTSSTGDNDFLKIAESAPSIDHMDKMGVIEQSTLNEVDNRQINIDALSLPEKNLHKSLSELKHLRMTEKNIVTGLEQIVTETILNELSQEINKKADIANEVLVDCGFWDFAGQRQYYPTHPIFLNPNALHLLVADIMKDINPINIEAGYDKIGEYIDFWFDSIHSCRDVKDTHNSPGDYLNPPVIVVCTGIDKCKDKLDDRKNEFRKQLLESLHNEDKQKHLRRICYISNTDPSAKDLDNLRQSIFEFGKKIETFGERLPLRWICVEKALAILCEAGVNILSWNEMADLAAKFSIQDVHEVSLFLKYHHKIGTIVYFESLKEHIILNQKWLADAFRCFISDKFDDDLKLTEEWKTLEKTGELKPTLIVKLFQKEHESKFYKHQDHLLKVMEMFGIIVKLETFKNDKKETGLWTYYMPCMISETTSVKQIYNVFGVNRESCTQTPWLCIQFDFMPFDFFNHIFCHYIGKYSVCIEAKTGRIALYHGIGVFFLDNTKFRKFMLCFSKNTIGMQIWHWRQLDHGKCKSMLEELRSLIHNVKDKFERRRVSYSVKIKCADGDIRIPAGRCSYTEWINLDNTEYFCEEHNKMHDTKDFSQTWFEEYTEEKYLMNSEEVLAEKTEQVQATYKTTRTLSISSEIEKFPCAITAKSLLIEKGTEIHDYRVYSPLMDACRKGDMSTTKLLIEKGGDYNATDTAGMTVFSCSCIGGNIDIIDFLITKGCDIHKPNNNGETPLMTACGNGQLSAVQRLIENGSDYNASDLTGHTVFNWSCVAGNVDIIDLLITKGCDIHKPNNNGETPLMAACSSGHLSAVQRLIENGSDYNASDLTGHTVFYWSCVAGNVDIIDLLITKGCDIHKPQKNGKQPLMAACGNGHLSAVQRLIENGSDYNASDLAGHTAFYWSCIGGNLDIIDLLITKGCDIHKPQNNEKTPLMAACDNGHLSAVQRLIENGSDYNSSDLAGHTVVYWSCIGGNLDIIDLLITKGCDIHKPQNNEKTPLMAACDTGHLSAVQRLIENGSDYNASDLAGHTVFYWSCIGGNVDIIDLLITKGCDIRKPQNNGKTPLMAACGSGHLSAVQRLIGNGSDYNVSDLTGNTVFSWSCVGGNIDIIDFLITKGCDIHKPNNEGETPLMSACYYGHLSAVQHLIKNGSDYNAFDITGQTVFYWSCVGGNVDIIDFFFTKDCDIHKPNNNGKTPLMAACGNGHLLAVHLLCERGADYNACDSSGQTVFFWSCIGGNVDIIDFLITKGCDIHKPQNNGKTPLMAACQNKGLSAVQRLIENGSNYNDNDSTGQAVFYWSCIGGNVDIIDFLITKGCDIHKSQNNGETPLMAACGYGHLSAVQLLCERGADYNACDSSGQTVFSWSCVGGNVQVKDFLVSKGCDVIT